ncbi:DUF5752 family protein [bacterium]|nr:DUF5752 family protein [bacterium]
MAFAVKDCALISLATGRRAQNLRELGLYLADIDEGSLYHHFWHGLLRPRFEDPEYQNDFASWARYGLNDRRLAERFAVIDPTSFSSMEDLRRETLEIIEGRLDESEHVPWSKGDQAFHFIRSQIVVFSTTHAFETPADLARFIPQLSTGSVFYHVIDARRRNTGRYDDFSLWLESFGAECEDVVHELRAIDPFFSSLTELRDKIASVMARHTDGGAK